MLGLPAVNADEDDDDIFGLASSRGKSTQYGLPAQARPEPEEDSEPQWDDESDYDATSIVPLSQLHEQMQSDANFGATGDSPDDDPTTAGDRAPETGVAAPNFASAWGLDEATDGSAPAPGDLSGGFAQYKPPRDEEHQVGTLLGMSLNELEEKREREDQAQSQASRSTQFALPAAQRDPERPDEPRTAVADPDTLSEISRQFDSDLDEDSEDSPTQAWNPADSPEFDEIIRQQSDSKMKSKLERLREKKHLLKSPDRDTARGIPSLPKSKQTDSSSGRPADPRKQVPRRPPEPTPLAQDDQRTSSISAQQLASLSEGIARDDSVEEAPATKNRGLETPASGVLKVPKRTNPPGSLRSDDTGVTGGGAYSKSRARGETTSDTPDFVDDPADSRSSRDARGLSEASWEEEYAYAETGIAPSRGLNIESDGRTPAKPSAAEPPVRPPASTPDPPATPPANDPHGHAASEAPAPETFQASNSEVKPFASSATGPKFPVTSSDASYPAQRNTVDGSLPSDPAFTPLSGSFEAQQQKKGLGGMSATDLFSDLPESVNTAPPGSAPPPSGPRTGAMEPGQGAQNFDFSAPQIDQQIDQQGNHLFGQQSGQQAHQAMADPSGSHLMNQPPGLQGQQDPEQDSLTRFIGRAQAVFGILSGLALLTSLYFSLQPFAVPAEATVALSLALVAVSGLGGLVLSLFPVSPGLRGIAFGILGLFALAAFGLVLTTVAPAKIVLALVLAGVVLAFVAALFPVIGKLVS